MEFIKSLADFFIHLDLHIGALTAAYGAWTYLIIFLIIFCETGLVVTPFLPGDSLLFVLGALSAQGTLHVEWLLGLLSAAAILGNVVNYSVGRILAPKVFNNERIPFLKQEYLNRTRDFYAKYGAKTIIITRFVPIIRTFAPFLAGVGSMSYGKFMTYNAVGGILWVFVGVLSGVFFGNLPFVQKNFSAVILMIVGISLIPAVIEYLKHRE